MPRFEDALATFLETVASLLVSLEEGQILTDQLESVIDREVEYRLRVGQQFPGFQKAVRHLAWGLKQEVARERVRRRDGQDS